MVHNQKPRELLMYKTFSPIIFLLIFTSCASFKKSSPTNVKNESSAKEGKNSFVDELDEETGETFEEEEKEIERIVGSSTITKKNAHKRGSYFLYGAEHLDLENNYFDFPVKYNKEVKKWIHYFTGRGRRHFLRYAERAGRYAPVMAKILDEYKLPKDLIFLAMAESGFSNTARSWAAAVGPWQFMPYTGRKFGLSIDWYLDERRDPLKASVAAAKYLTRLYEIFGNWELAAAGYNAGEGKMMRAIKRYKTENFWKIIKGRYLKPETKNYVPKIMALAIIGKNLNSFGFEKLNFQKTLDFETIEVKGESDLYLIAKKLGTTYDEIHKWNPELLRWITPPNVLSYTLRLPLGLKQKWNECCVNDLNQFKATDYQTYRVRGKRSTLKDVAKKFKLKPYVLEKLNNLKSYSRLKKRQKVKLPFRLGQSKKDRMYADLYYKPRKSVVRKRTYRRHIKIAKSKGKLISNPSTYHTVKRGETLWNVARKYNLSVYTLIRSNLKILNRRMIRAGDKLAVR
ncbi:MAG: lytic transglycosylase [Halobacteriovoraceae bacterium]|nr:lytic transglycosylase [Halobacteriovoraceae bacterium]